MPNELEEIYANCCEDCFNCDYASDCPEGRSFIDNLISYSKGNEDAEEEV